MKTTAIVLAAGRGKRMQSDKPKQYLEIDGKPILYYTLKAFEDSFIDEVILVTSKGDISYCKEEIVENYGFSKVSQIVEGGKERYHSVMSGIFSAKDCDVIFIHDGARPFVKEEMLERLLQGVKEYKACVAAVPVKDTVKIADADGFIETTPNRNLLWAVQTPQVFAYELIESAYKKLEVEEVDLLNRGIQITDDAMVVETLLGEKVKLIEGDYCNIKITTPEDLDMAQILVKKALK